MNTESLKGLVTQVRACTVCEPHLPNGVRPVLQVNSNAKILIAGQAPGRRVHASGIPFDDPSGDRLRDWMGVSSEQFYNPELFAIVPMGFCYPGTGKSVICRPDLNVQPLGERGYCIICRALRPV